MSEIGLICPSCSASMPVRDQRRMNRLWGLRPVPCSGCGKLLQYHKDIRSRLRVGGHIFRLGVLCVFVWLIIKLTGIVSPAILEISGLASFAIVLAGILATASRRSSIRVELVGES